MKVFGIGLARTGTTSLHEAMGILGVSSAPSSVALLDTIDAAFLAEYDAFFDNPVPFRYTQLAEVVPDARWIVTQRNVDDWIDSMRWLFGEGLDRLDPAIRSVGDAVHRDVYGTDRFDETRLRAVYANHYGEVSTWIADRPHVWLHVEDGFGWEPICELIGRPVPQQPFPHANPRPTLPRRSRAKWSQRRRR